MGSLIRILISSAEVVWLGAMTKSGRNRVWLCLYINLLNALERLVLIRCRTRSANFLWLAYPSCSANWTDG
jgi:hypothetical protein